MLAIFRVGLWMALALVGTAAFAGDGEAKVFPVRAYFYDAQDSSPLDPRFRAMVSKSDAKVLSAKVHATLGSALKDKIGPLDRNTAGRTFAVSFHVSRAISYSIDKGNGNSDLVASLTASLYFTNVLSGEILTTLSKTVITRSVVSNSGLLDDEKEQLFAQASELLLSDLADAAAKNFSPNVIDLRVTDVAGKLLVLDAGINKGIQSGDSLSDISGQLVSVVYSGETYAVAQRILADGAGPGTVFRKYLTHATDGQVKPRTVVLVESLPQGFSREYVAQLFSELVGDKAPLSVVLVNPGFGQLLRVITQQASLDVSDSARRNTPELFVRLRVADPIVYEGLTNLDFKTVRHYETLAFADIVDTSARVVFSVMGKDVIDDSITRGVGPGFAERREVSVKNALLDLAAKLGKLAVARRDRLEVASVEGELGMVDAAGKSYAPKQVGMVLRRFTSSDSGKAKNAPPLWIPVTESWLDDGESAGKKQLSMQLALDAQFDKINVGDVFEVQLLGTSPLSAQIFSLCGSSESLGNVQTPSLVDLAANALGARMPGMLYAMTVPETAKLLISPGTGFVKSVTWNLPASGLCVLPVERVNASDAQCTVQCETSLTARYTLRVKKGAEVLAKPAFEGQFRSSSFYKQIDPEQLKKLIDADLVDEAQKLLGKAAEKVTF
jgi:hypothetical protein